MHHPVLRTLGLFAAFAAALCLAACDPKPDDTGIVARVNGRPISLHQLQLKHDFDQLGLAPGNPSVARLRDEYGASLSDLVIRELVFQELEERGIAVTDEEVAAAEADIRADYPEGAFEEVLVEEYIDINYWRDELRARLSIEKFFDEVLRPGVTIDYREAEEYYRDHLNDFYLPQRVQFVRVGGPSRDVMENAIKFYRGGGALDAMSAEFDQITVRSITMHEDRLTKDWADALSNLESGEVSGVMTAGNGFEALIFQENIPERVLAPSQAYPAIERELLDRKLLDAFNAWLEARLATATISVTPHLDLDDRGPEATAQPAAPETADPQAEELQVAPEGEYDAEAPGEEPEGQ